MKAIKDYNAMFGTSYGRRQQKSFRTITGMRPNGLNKGGRPCCYCRRHVPDGFDAPTLNTLFVDKNLRYHGLIQAFSRTNRIYDTTKTFGNIVTFRDLEQPTIDAITLFGDKIR